VLQRQGAKVNLITIDMDALTRAIYSNTDASEQEARSIINTVGFAAPAPASEAVAEPIAHFGLAVEQIDALRTNSLKPEEIAGAPDVQLDRVRELVWWFARLADNHANPKWTRGHAFELAYYVASMDVKRGIDLKPIRDAAFKEGCNITPSERGSLERIGFLATPSTGDSTDAPEQQAAMSIEEERAAFESTMAKRSPGCDFHRFNKDNYSNRFTHNAWDGWLARAALKGEQPAQPSGSERGEV
jgi:hypothetical protein